MTEMREWWANVYRSDEGVRAGLEFLERRNCVKAMGSDALCRIHVRLKPEGAPKRYASEANRRAWELYPKTCKSMVFCGCDAGLLASHSGEVP